MSPIKNTFEGRPTFEDRAKKGERLSNDEVGSITKQTADLGGVEEEGTRSRFDPAQVCWASKTDEILSKPVDQLNKTDARALQSREEKAFGDLPATGSVSSHVSSIADKNER